MKKLLIALSVLAMTTACNSQKNPFLEEWSTPYGTAPFSQIKTEHYLPAFQAGIAEKRAGVQAIIDNPEAPTFENTVAAYEQCGPILERVSGVFFNLSESESTPEMQKIEEEVMPLITDLENEIFMNEKFFARVKAVYEAADGLDREQQMVVKKFYETFVRGGVALEGDARARLQGRHRPQRGGILRFHGLLPRPRQTPDRLRGLCLPRQPRGRA